jgi:formate/nitrite transporter
MPPGPCCSPLPSTTRGAAGRQRRAHGHQIAETKAQLGSGAAFLRGILCNVLVCLAVWLSVAARSVEGKAIAIVFPISAFVALGFEHCIANLYLLPVGMLAGANVSLVDFAANLVPVALGNTVGGAALGLIYWLVHLSDERPTQRGLDAASMKSGWFETLQLVRAKIAALL